MKLVCSWCICIFLTAFLFPSSGGVFSQVVDQDIITNSIGMKMKLIPAGEFVMGSENGEKDEKPSHKVKIENPFYICIYEVTVGQWNALMKGTDEEFKVDGYISNEKDESLNQKIEELESLESEGDIEESTSEIEDMSLEEDIDSTETEEKEPSFIDSLLGWNKKDENNKKREEHIKKVRELAEKIRNENTQKIEKLTQEIEEEKIHIAARKKEFTESFPVSDISYYKCINFINLLNKKEGKKYRLPTEAEWEYACRAGSFTEYIYGDDESKIGEYGWSDNNSDQKVHVIGSKNPNLWGLYDMTGNLWEVCQDRYQEDFYQRFENKDALSPVNINTKVNDVVIRGGSYNTGPYFMRSSSRKSTGLDNSDESIGFRLVLPISSQSSAPIVSVQLPEMTNSIGIKFVKIPAGEFMMGSEQGDSVEVPVHKVKIEKPYYLGVYEVSQKQWLEIMDENPSSFKGSRDNPVETIDARTCQKFIRKLSLKEGREYRLPTEAEWEYACRSGSTSEYFFGDDPNELEEYAWFSTNNDKKTHASGKKKPNQWGLYDMYGNVTEMCADTYDPEFYSKDDENGQSPVSTLPIGNHVIRGSSYFMDSFRSRSAARDRMNDGECNNHVGFRLVLVPPEESRYVVNGDGTVTDRENHLMWIQDLEKAGLNKPMTFKEANEFLQNFSYAGYSDWIMPSIFDLSTLVDLFGRWPAQSNVFNYMDVLYFSSTMIPHGEKNFGFFMRNNGKLPKGDINSIIETLNQIYIIDNNIHIAKERYNKVLEEKGLSYKNGSDIYNNMVRPYTEKREIAYKDYNNLTRNLKNINIVKFGDDGYHLIPVRPMQ